LENAKKRETLIQKGPKRGQINTSKIQAPTKICFWGWCKLGKNQSQNQQNQPLQYKKLTKLGKNK